MISLFVVTLCVCLAVVATAVGIVRVAIQTFGHFDVSDLSFFVVMCAFIPAGIYVKNNWKVRSTFIAIGDSRSVVYPADRRDEVA